MSKTTKKENTPKTAERIGLLTETSWEVCHKIGGIYTVLSTKAKVLSEKYGDRLVFIGPDVWTDENKCPYFAEDKKLLGSASENMELPYNLKIRTGRWNIPGSPQVVLVKFDGVYPELDGIYGDMWKNFQVDSLHAYGDYSEGCAFAVATALVTMGLAKHLGVNGEETVAHFNEWTTAMGLLYLKLHMPQAATLFTTHATSIGRSICGNGKPLYDYFTYYNGDQMAHELNMESKHSLEKAAAHQADCFTSVSELTAKECEQLLEIRPQVVTPNGFEPDFVPTSRKYKKLRDNGRKRLLEIASRLKGREFAENTCFVATSGRNEYRNKGLDLFIDSMVKLEEENPANDVVAFILVPAWVKEPVGELLLDDRGELKPSVDLMTHRLNNEGDDRVCCRLRQLESERKLKGKVEAIYVPCYLDGRDGIVGISYYDILPALDITVFASYYEPWGYTPLESIAFGVPTVTTDKSGFGQWILSDVSDSIQSSGVKVISRTDSNYGEAMGEIASTILDFINVPGKERGAISESAVKTAEKANWKYFIQYYYDAFNVAMSRRDFRMDKSKR